MAHKRHIPLCYLFMVMVGFTNLVTAQTQQLPQNCPNPTSSASSPGGCTCIPLPNSQTGLCGEGFVCTEPWMSELLASQSQSAALTSGIVRSPDGPFRRSLHQASPPIVDLPPVSESVYVCIPCNYGQYCPEGSILPVTDDPVFQLLLARLTCPFGTYCPTPAESIPCEVGSYCGPGTTAPTTCNMSVLVEDYPQLYLPTKPNTVYESVYIKGQTLAGNYCPANSSSPARPCKAGYYCPTPGESNLCPAGYFCKAGSQAPAKCPIMTSCPAGSEKGNLSWAGFLFLFAILTALWLSYLLLVTFIRVTQRRLQRTQAARERLWKLLNPMFASQQHSSTQAFRAFKAIRPKLDIEFEDLGLTLHDNTVILSGVTGKFAHSRVTAILGPSGAGKSTFLNVIMGKSKALGRQTGSIRINGRDMHPTELKGIVGFVPQEDVVHEDLTVRENLVYSARLRLSAGKPVKEQMAIVDDVINVLQLRHVQHNVVGSAERRGISGGQRKRVNIGMELASKPSILFADEPTSGLDATAAADILDALKRIAGLGMNIITVIHQPRYSIFQTFDDVMLLGKGGKLAYLGPSTLAVPYLQSLGFVTPPNENPADFIMDVLAGSVRREGEAVFHPEGLISAWEATGREYVRSQARPAPTTAIQRQLAVDPEQIRLLEERFDAVDSDADGSINEVELKAMLVGLGVEPTSGDVDMIKNELADPRTGMVFLCFYIIRKDNLLLYVRCGGRPPTTDVVPEAQRRVHSLYRVYSIEQYNLANALDELQGVDIPQQQQQTIPRKLTSGRVLVVPTAIDEDSELPSPTNAEQGMANSSPDTKSKKRVTTQDGNHHISLAASAVSQASELSAASQAQLQKDSMFRGSLSLSPSMGRAPAKLRNSPGLFGQLFVLMSRSMVKWARNWTSKFTDVLLIIFAALACGAIHGTGSEANDVRGHTALVMLTIGILSTATSLSVFGRDKLVFWRERSTGLRVLPYFLSSSVMNLLDVAIQPLIFIAIYQSMTLPAISLGLHYAVALSVVWWCSSAGCLISVLIGNAANALVAAVALVMVIGGFINGVNPPYRGMGTITRQITLVSYNRWAVEAVAIGTFENYPDYARPLVRALMNGAGHCGLIDSNIPVFGAMGTGDPYASEFEGYNLTSIPPEELEQQDIHVYCAGYLTYSLVAIVVEGFVLRLCALFALYFCPRGLTLEPVVLAVTSGWWKMRGWKRVKKQTQQRRTVSLGPTARV